MVSNRFSNLSSVRKQHLLVEFASLKHACPHGVFMSLTPGDPSLWSGIIFVRKGPYAPSILRFQISFPSTYPLLPPLVTFSTDIFHPLITPLTTYMYTTDIQAEGTVSATDDERLPPGGFSLRDLGVEGWFGRASRRSPERQRAKNSSLEETPSKRLQSPTSGTGSSQPSPSPRKVSGGSAGTNTAANGPHISTYEVLRYIRSTFDDETVLDSIPLSAAGNPGAWHAWRSYRVKSGAISTTSPLLEVKDRSKAQDRISSSEDSAGGGVGEVQIKSLAGTPAPASARRPGEWNWDGVWEVRVRKGIDNSISEGILYGKEAGDDLIRFLPLEQKDIDGIKGDMEKSQEVVDVQRRGVV